MPPKLPSAGSAVPAGAGSFARLTHAVQAHVGSGEIGPGTQHNAEEEVGGWVLPVCNRQSGDRRFDRPTGARHFRQPCPPASRSGDAGNRARNLAVQARKFRCSACYKPAALWIAMPPQFRSPSRPWTVAAPFAALASGRGCGCSAGVMSDCFGSHTPARVPFTARPRNHSWHLTRRERRGCNRCVPCAGSLSLDR